MRPVVLRKFWADAGASFRVRNGCEIVSRCGPRDLEYRAIRDCVGLTDFGCVRAFRVPESTGLDLLDSLVAGNVPRIRFGRVLHTFIADAEGQLVADCYVANNDQELWLLSESIADSELDRGLAEAGVVGMEELSDNHVLLGLDGPKAWQVVRKLLGPDVLGLPYLSLETYPFEGSQLRLIRAGKTSEFGYLLWADRSVSERLFGALRLEIEGMGGRLCGLDIHDELRLEGRFFNIQAEGARVRDPLVLGLQWMIDLEKATFRGREAILGRRAEGLRRKIVGIAFPGDARDHAVTGQPVFCAGRAVGELVATAYSDVLNRSLGLAVVEVDLAYVGLDFQVGSVDGLAVRSISMPPILPKSLGIKLDEL